MFRVDSPRLENTFLSYDSLLPPAVSQSPWDMYSVGADLKNKKRHITYRNGYVWGMPSLSSPPPLPLPSLYFLLTSLIGFTSCSSFQLNDRCLLWISISLLLNVVMITTLGDWLKNISLHFRKIKSIGDFFAQVFRRASRVFASYSG